MGLPVKKLIGSLVLGLAFVIAASGMVGCGGTTTKVEVKDAKDKTEVKVDKDKVEVKTTDKDKDKKDKDK